jgi:hypothetical protein
MGSCGLAPGGGRPRTIRVSGPAVPARFDSQASITTLSGTSTSEMSCEVENIATAPRSSPRKNSMMKRDTP